MQVILQSYTSSTNPLWNMRFYVLLTECFQDWSASGYDSCGQMTEKLRKKVPFFQQRYYLDADPSKLEEKDAEFLKTQETRRSGSAQDFSSKFKELQQKRKMFLHELFKKRIVIQELSLQKKAYQKEIIQQYEMIERFLK